MTGLLARVAVPGIFGAELHDLGQALPLPADEQRLVAGAAPKRQRDFALGRACAHAALMQLGRDEGPLGKKDDGGPLWPDGIVGSITHTEGYAAALVALAADFAGLGIDAERAGRVTDDLWPRLFDAAEREQLSRLADAGEMAALLFSAKEACHKAGQQRVLRFAELHVVLAQGTFTACRAGEEFEGRYAVADGLVLTAAWRR